MTTIFVLLCMSTVYCRYHYVVDVFAGLMLGGLVMYFGSPPGRFGPGQIEIPATKKGKSEIEVSSRRPGWKSGRAAVDGSHGAGTGGNSSRRTAAGRQPQVKPPGRSHRRRKRPADPRPCPGRTPGGKGGKPSLDPLGTAGRTVEFAVFEFGQRQQFLELMAAFPAGEFENRHWSTSRPKAKKKSLPATPRPSNRRTCPRFHPDPAFVPITDRAPGQGLSRASGPAWGTRTAPRGSTGPRK